MSSEDKPWKTAPLFLAVGLYVLGSTVAQISDCECAPLNKKKWRKAREGIAGIFGTDLLAVLVMGFGILSVNNCTRRSKSALFRWSLRAVLLYLVLLWVRNIVVRYKGEDSMGPEVAWKVATVYSLNWVVFVTTVWSSGYIYYGCSDLFIQG